MLSKLPPNALHTALAVLALGVVLSLLLEALRRSLDSGRYAWQRRLRQRLGVADGAPIRELRWLTVLIQLLLWPLLGYGLLRLWKLDDLGEAFLDRLLGAGFKLGGTTVVPGKLLLGLAAFILLVTFTRWFKRKLEHDWLPLTGLDAGVRVSVATLFGYITFAIAAMIGLSAAGLDLSKIAIVAGALSVGIGFGLQNIVNNFVSGLILLFERPVRVGDYVRVGGAEGFVRRIRIRATELESWDRISIIVPNSVLLSSNVENFQLRNSLGRAVVRLPLPLGSPVDTVRERLLQVAQTHPRVIQEGQRADVSGPAVTLIEITETALIFELAAPVADVNSRGGIAGELRVAALAALAASGISLSAAPRELLLRERLPDPA